MISRLIQTGGRSIDDAIQSAIRKEYSFFIGSKTAENIKKELAYAIDPEEKTMQICGRNMDSRASADAGIVLCICI